MTAYAKMNKRVFGAAFKNAALLMLFVLFCGSLNVWGASQEEQRELPPYVRIVDFYALKEGYDLPDSVFYKVSQGVIFPVNKYVLNENAPLIIDLKEWVLPEVRRRDLELAGIGLRGAASPEGPWRWNVTLSERRAKALTDFILAQLGQETTDIIQTSKMPEDYIYLVLMMEEANDSDAELVRSIVEKYTNDPWRLKVELQKVDQGRLWKRLLRTYYPHLRAARLVLFFRAKQPEERKREFHLVEVRQPGITQLIHHEPAPLVFPKLRPRRHVLSLKSNLLYDVFYMPNFGWGPMWNIEAEYYPKHGQLTYTLDFTSPYYHRWKKNKFFQIRDYRFETRYYFRKVSYETFESCAMAHTGLYIGAYVNANKYGIGFNKKKGWQGEGFGGGITGGYVTRLARSGRWKLNFEAAVGFYTTRHDPYVYGDPLNNIEDGDYYYDTTDPKNFKKRNHRFSWFGPTKIGVALSYDLFYKRIMRKGIGTRRGEVIW